AHLVTVLLSASCTLSLLLMFHRLVIGTESVVPESSITKRERDTKEEAFASSFLFLREMISSPFSVETRYLIKPASL
ncbi:hypothetical protein ACTQ65_003614, partial [Vibrio cholerae]